MKKLMTYLLMSLIGLVGTLAWAGSAGEDSVDRMERSDSTHAIYGKHMSFRDILSGKATASRRDD